MRWYYYLHTNGSLIGKNPYVADSDSFYCDSPFVVKFWLTDSQDRASFWQVALEALAHGAQLASITTFAKANGLGLEDSIQMIKYIKPADVTLKGFRIFVEEILRVDWETYWAEVNKELDLEQKKEDRVSSEKFKGAIIQSKKEKGKKDYKHWN